MAWVVDTSVLFDIWLANSPFAAASAACLREYASDGLVLCPVSYVELAPTFQADQTAMQKFLQEVNVKWTTPWQWDDTEAASRLWAQHVANKRTGHAGKRPLPDVLIEAFATRFQGLITRNPRHFKTVPVVVP